MKIKLLTVLLSVFAIVSWADTAPVKADVLSVQTGKTRIIQLKKLPAVVMVGNPAIADVIIERNRQIFIVGIAPGETNLFALDENGKKILNADVVVTQILPRHVTVERGTDSQTLSCNPRYNALTVRAARGAGQTEAVGEADNKSQQPAAPAGGGTGGAAAAN